MSEANISSVLTALLTMLGGAFVALLTYWLSRRKTAAEIKLIEVQIEKMQRELGVVGNVTSAVSYKISASNERIIYDSAGRDIGYDFIGSKARVWQRIDGVDRAVSGYGLGQFSSENGVLNIQRTNTEGRFEVWLQTYSLSDKTSPLLTRDESIQGERGIRISFEAKVVGASHTLRVLLKNEKTDKWPGEDSRIISTNVWVPVNIYFRISPAEECRLRIDDLDVTGAPSSIQIRNFVVAEKVS